MPRERRRLMFLGLLCVALLAAVIRFWPQAAVNGVSRPGSTQTARARGGPASITAPDVHLRALGSERPKPGAEPQRDLFRFKPKAPPPRAAEPSSAPPPSAASVPSGPPPPPAVPPIAMRFIGLVESPEHGQKIAIFSDGRGIYQGREGDIIEGRYRILRIGVESVEMAYLDGRGRQTIRLSGS